MWIIICRGQEVSPDIINKAALRMLVGFPDRNRLPFTEKLRKLEKSGGTGRIF